VCSVSAMEMDGGRAPAAPCAGPDLLRSRCGRRPLANSVVNLAVVRTDDALSQSAATLRHQPYRNPRKNAWISAASSAGCSIAAK